MKHRGIFRRIILPGLWLVIGLAVAASLVKLAFLGESARAGDDPLTPTGQVPSETVTVAKGTVRNVLTVTGTIELDPARSALSSADGVFVYAFVEEGDRVQEGDRLFQVRSEELPEPSGDPEAPPRPPRTIYTNVVAPVAGKVSGFAFEIGDDVTKGAVMASVQPGTFKAVGGITPLDRYRLLDRPDKAEVTIKGGPKPFTCTHLTIGDAASAPATPGPEEGGFEEGGAPDAEAASSITCRVPSGVTVFDGLDMSMAIRAGTSKNVLVVPVTAVRGLLGSGSVWVVGEDGIETEQPVRLGITDGKVIEVKSGLRPGSTVLRYVPGSDAPSEEEREMRGGVVLG